MELHDQEPNAFGDQGTADLQDGSTASSVASRSAGRVLVADEAGVVVLPAGTELGDIQIEGRDLVVIGADGVRYVIPDGAIIVPQLVIDDVAIPPLNLAALLIGNEPQPAAGNPQSSGGNFAGEVDPLQAAYALGDLLPYTELAFSRPQDEEVIPQPVDRDPTIIVITVDQPAGVQAATATVAEAGLPARNGEPAGSNAAATTEATTGTIVFSSPDGVTAITINGTTFTGAGQTISSPRGTLQITSFDPAAGTIGFTYTLTDNLVGATLADEFVFSVTDPDGDVASASLTVSALDDAPTARADTDSVAAGSFAAESGNVITAAGTTSGAPGADTVGADNATISRVASNNVVANVDTSFDAAGNLQVSGQYGTLLIKADGSYSYTRATGTPGGVTDAFTYTLTDSDGSASTATLTISIADAKPVITSVPPANNFDAGTLVFEAGLPSRPNEAPGTNAPAPTETTSGKVTFAGGDGPVTATINGVAVVPGATVTIPGVGTLTVSSFNPVGGELTYTFTLADNTAGDNTGVTFNIVVTDVDGDTAPGTFTIAIRDDSPTATSDMATQAIENAPVTINVLANDLQGADSVQPGTVTLVSGSLSGAGALVNNGDGSFTYTPAPGEKGPVTFDYSITDGDGDTSTAKATIALIADSEPQVGQARNLSVDEDGLASANPDMIPLQANPAEVAGGANLSDTGTVTVNFSGDIPANLAASVALLDDPAYDGQLRTLDGNPVIFALESGVLVGRDSAGAEVIRVAVTDAALGSNPGEVIYTYSTLLSQPVQHPAAGSEDSVTLSGVTFRVTDLDGDSATGSFTISLRDDVPTAMDDGPFGVTEDGLSMVSGDVLTNDVSGADTPRVFTEWSALNAAEVAQLNVYGTLTLNGDGTWSYVLDNTRAATQALDAGDMLSFTLDYTMADADGDESSAVLTITVTGSDDDASVTTAAAMGPDNTVLEAGLNPDGSDAASDSETDTGSFAVAASDGIGSVTIGGQAFTLAQVQAFAATNGVVDTGEGTLTLTGYTGTAFGGTVSYSYTLKATIDNDSAMGATGTAFDDSIAIAVAGIGGSSGSDDLVVRIVDDVPTAMDDGPFGVTEDGLSMVSGDVLTNDVSGADTPRVFTEWSALNAAEVAQLNVYGTLTLNGDGTWSYVLDNSRAATQALDAGDMLSFTLDYTMADADGDESSAVLTITVTGSDDDASVTTAAAMGPDNTVLEAGLNPDGSDAASDSETDTGSFAVAASDGIGSVTIGGQAFTLAQVQAFAATNGVVDTGEGTLTLTGYTGTAFGGTVSYSYTLKATIDNDSAMGATGTAFDDSIAIAVAGIGGSSGSDDLVVRIVDDVPTAMDDGPFGVTEDGLGMVSGDVLTNDVSGADTPRVFTEWSALNAAEVAQLNVYGTLTLNGDGTWSYVLDNTRAATQALDAGDMLSFTLDYTMADADGDESSAVLTITVTGSDDDASVTTAAAMGPDNTVLEAGLNPDGSDAASDSETDTGSFAVAASDGIGSVTIGGQAFTLAQVQAFAATNGVVDTGEGTLTLTGYTGTAFGGTVSYSYTLKATIDNDSTMGATGTAFDDSIAIAVAGIGGSSGSDDLVVRIVDDVPTAMDDGPFGVTEDGLSMVSGDVLTNDVSGADTPRVFTEWSALNAAEVAQLNVYGTLTLNGDGTWSYVLDNTRAATQALDAGDMLSFTLDYTMADADGDESSAVLTITVTGSDDDASVTTAAAMGPDNTVLEAGLNPDGSDAASDSETDTGSFAVAASDGIGSVTIGGQAFTLAQVQAFAATNGVVDTGEGTLTLTGYTGTAFGGTVSYSYTLKATIDNDSAMGATGTAFDDSIAIAVAGIGGSSGSDDLVVRIVDDVPTAMDDGPFGVTEDGLGMVSGDVLTNDVSGADTPRVFTEWSALNAAEVAQLNVYGTLTLNGDGTWSYVLDNTRAATQALDAGDMLSFTLDYTMADADGDESSAVLTITVTGSDDDASVTTAAAMGPDNTVLEAGLNPDGSDAASDSETDTGSFAVAASDGIGSVTIGGQAFTLAQVQAFAATNGVVDTGEGTLTLTGYTGTAFGGTVSYSYTLKATIDNDSAMGATGTAFDDSIAIAVAGIGGSSGSDDLVVRIVDDVPTAMDDGPFGVTEDGLGMVSGDVLTNDVSGADTPRVFTEWSALNAAEVAQLNVYGTLTLNGDGTWSYVLDNTRAATQALDAGDMLSFTLDYTMADADGDESSAVLTITVTGSDDDASVTTAAAMGPDNTVLEAGLNPDGSDAASDSETDTGSFAVAASDGIGSVTIGGQAFTLAQVQAFAATNGVVDTGEGTLTLTGYTGTAFGGTVSYSYTLKATIDNDSTMGATGTAFDDSIAIAVAGIGGSSGSDDLVVRIVDDVPTAMDDGPFGVTEDGLSMVSGDVLTNDVSGADTPRVFTEWSALNAAEVAQLNVYGTLTLNGDGTWSYVLDNTRAATQALDAGDMLSFTLDYTMADADGDESSAVLTITVTGSDDDASVTTAAAMGPDNTVLEAGLNPDGSDAASDSETDTGSFAVAASDGIGSVTIGGQAFTLAQVQAFAATNGVVDTGEGTLTLTGYTGTAFGGTVSYSYTLKATIDNDSAMGATGTAFDDSIAIAVAGIGGSSGSDDLVVRIVDDVPTAMDDGPFGVTEDGLSMVSGDVLTNDVSGADTPRVFTEWSALNAAEVAQLNVYGTLTLNGDGTWSYVLDNSRAATQALDAGDMLSFTLDYTMADADGDESSAVLTITVTGSDDDASVTTAAAMGPDNTVLEAGLNPDGSDAASDSETDTGSFAVAASDGIGSVTIGGQAFTLAQVQAFAATNGVVDTGEGTLTLTGYTGTAFGGTVSYSYTLKATIDNDSAMGATGTAFDDSIAIAVAGIGGSSGSDDLVVRIVDDVPTAMDDGPFGVTEDGLSMVSGDVLTNDVSGADTPRVFTEWSALNAAEVAQLNVYGTLTLNGDGTWSYVLDNSRAATQALDAGDMLSFTLDYTMADADGDESSAVLTITVTGSDDDASVTTAAAMGPDNTVLEAGLNPDGSDAASDSETDTGSFAVAASDGIGSVTIGGQAFTLAQVQAFAATNGVVDTGEGTLTLTGYTGTAFGGTVSYSYTLKATIDNDSAMGATGTAFDDSIAIAVAGIGGSSGSDDLVVRIVDDVPTAMDDGPFGVTEDGLSMVSGDVLTNDVSGADTPRVFTEWSALNAAEVAQLNVYGTLTLNGDGTWSYVLDNTRAATQALDAGDMLSFTLDYTMADADGDESSAVLTITVTGSDDDASVTTAAAMGPDNTVLEAGLNPDGSDAASDSETDTGSFAVAASDGIGSVTIGGQAFTLAQVQAFAATNGVVDTGEGTLTLTGYTGTAFGGTVSYSYTLKATIDNDSTMGATGTAFDDSIAIAVAGIGGSSGSDDLVVRIVDDVPTANPGSSLNVVETDGATTGVNLLANDVPGADGASVTHVDLGDGNGFVAITSGVPVMSAPGSYSFTVVGKGTYVFAADGSWSFDPVPVVNPLGAGVDASFMYRITDGDDDVSEANQTVTITDGADPTLSVTDVTVDEKGLTKGSGEYADHFGPGEDLNSDPSETASGTFTITQGADGIQSVEVQASNGMWIDVTGATVMAPVIVTGTNGNLSVTSDGAGNYSYSFTLDSNVTHSTPGAGEILGGGSFAVRVTDDDGDMTAVTAATTIDVSVRDDAPIVYAKDTPIQIANSGTVSGSGNFDFTVGADQQATYSSVNSDFSTITLTGTVGGNQTIASTPLMWVSETAAQATFSFSFTYQASGMTQNTTGTLVFDKVNGTYTVDLDSPIQASVSPPSVSGSTSIVGYEPGTATEDKTQPFVTVAQITPDLFVQFTGFDGTIVSNPVPSQFSPGETLSGTPTFVSISGAANGVAGDTMGKSEVLDLDFFTTDPQGFDLVPDARVSTVFIKFDGIGNNEDLIVILKLFDTVTMTTTTRALYVANGDFIKGTAPAAYSGITLDNNDALIVIEPNDYRLSPADANLVLIGAQITATDEGITGPAINFNGTTGAMGGSVAGQNLSNDTNDTGFKVSDIGFLTTTTTLQNASLTFNFQLKDSEGDFSANQTLVANVVNQVTPVALDLDGGGIEFLSLEHGIGFNYGDDGSLVTTAWVGGGDGVLAFDANDNGRVDDGSEIVFSSGFGSDLEGLAARYGDVLDLHDADFAKFGVWQDANGDGLSDPGEFRSLSDAGIVSISLVSDGQGYTAAGGDVTVFGSSTYTRADGTTGALADAAFATRARDAQRTAELVTTAAVAGALIDGIHAAAQPAAAEFALLSGVNAFAPVLSESILARPDGVRQVDIAQLEQSAPDALVEAEVANAHIRGESTDARMITGDPDFDHDAPGPDYLAELGGMNEGPGHGASLFAAMGTDGMMDALLVMAPAPAAIGDAQGNGADALAGAMADFAGEAMIDGLLDRFAPGEDGSAVALGAKDAGAAMLMQDLGGSAGFALMTIVPEASDDASMLAAAQA